VFSACDGRDRLIDLSCLSVRNRMAARGWCVPSSSYHHWRTHQGLWL